MPEMRITRSPELNSIQSCVRHTLAPPRTPCVPRCATERASDHACVHRVHMPHARTLGARVTHPHERPHGQSPVPEQPHDRRTPPPVSMPSQFDGSRHALQSGKKPLPSMAVHAGSCGLPPADPASAALPPELAPPELCPPDAVRPPVLPLVPPVLTPAPPELAALPPVAGVPPVPLA